MFHVLRVVGPSKKGRHDKRVVALRLI